MRRAGCDAARFTLFIFAMAVVPFAGREASADLILAWDLLGAGGDEASIAATTQNFAGPAASLTRGPGLIAIALTNGFNSNGFTAAGTIANATANGDYYQFSFTTPSDTVMSFSDLDANFRRTNLAPNTFQWQYNIGAGFVGIGSPFSFTGLDTNGTNQPDIILSGISDLQNVAPGSSVTFRLLAAGANNFSPQFGIGRLSGNDLVLNGSMSSVPEPTSLALGAFGAAVFGAAWRRRTRSEPTSCDTAV